MKRMLSLGLAWLVCGALAYAKDVPARPNTLVNDYAQLLAPQEVFALEKKLRAYNDSTSTQIAIVIDRSLEGEDAFEYALAIAEKWQVGQAGKNNGVFIYLALTERKIQILAGQGVQGFLPDVEIGRIIREILQPAFRANQYYAGLDQAIDRIIGLGNGEFKKEKSTSSGGAMALVLILLIVFGVMILFYFLSKRGQTQGYSSDGSYRYDGNRRVYRRGYQDQGGGGWIFFPPTFGGGGGSNWSGGSGDSDFGGFDGFGGGGFDGGGAGGDW